MHGGSDGKSPSHLAHLPFWDDEMRLAPSMPTLHSLAPLALSAALSTSQVFHKFQLSKPPTDRAPLLGVWERVPFLLLLSFWLSPEEGGDLWSQFQWLLQVRVFGSHCLSTGHRVPSGRVVFKVGDQAALRPHLAVPPLLPPGSMYLVVPIPGVCPHLWLTPGKGEAELLYLFFQGHCHGQGFLVSFPHISQTSFY